MDTVADRLRWARRKHGLTQRELAKRTGVGLNTIRRIEQEPKSFTPQLGTVEKLAAALHVRAGWLAFGEDQMVMLADKTPEAQIKAQTGPGTEALPGFVVVVGCPRYRDSGTWRVEGAKKEKELK